MPDNVIDNLPRVLVLAKTKNAKLVLDVLSQLTGNDDNRLKCAGSIVSLYDCFGPDFK